MASRRGQIRGRAWLALTLAALLWCAGPAAGPRAADAQADPIHTRMNGLLGGTDGTKGFYLRQIGGGVLANQNETTVFEPASTIKVLIHLHALREVQAGRAQLSDQVTNLAGVANSCPDPKMTAGTERLDTALRGLMQNSDNPDTRALREHFGDTAINATATTAGMTNSGFNANHINGCASAKNNPNRLTLVDAGRLYEGVANGTLLSGTARDSFYALMPGTEQFDAMGFDSTGLYPLIQGMIDDEAPAGTSAALKASFLADMRLNYKAGSYTFCDANGACSEHRSIAGWAQMPFCAGGVRTPRQYVFGVFITNATNGTNAENAINATKAELLREQIEAALASCADNTPPRITLTVDASDQLASTGWYNRASSGSDGIRVTVTATDLWGVTSLRCQNGTSLLFLTTTSSSGAFTLNDGTHSITCSASDGAGNSGAGTGSTAMPAVYRVDQTPPTLMPTVTPNPVLLRASATASANATDATSGVASSSCGAVDTSTVGAKSVSCSATDNAGNSATASANYRVIYDFRGFFPPVDNPPTLNRATAGSAIPVKFSLRGNQGLAIFAAGYPTSRAVPCNAGAPTSGIEQTVAAGGSSLSYDATADQYVYVWKTEASWAGTCRQLVVRLDDGTDHVATFEFR